MSNEDLTSLFVEAWKDNLDQEASFELDQLLFRDFSKEKEEFQILFQLADDAIIDPESEKRYIDEIKTSVGITLKSGDIAEKLAFMESALKSTIFSLKAGGPKLSQQDQTQIISGAIEPAKRIINPPWKIRLKSELFDISYILAMALIGTLFIAWFTEPTLHEDLLAPARMAPPEIACFCALFLAIFLFTMIFYQLFSGTQTTGQKIFKLEILSHNGRSPSQKRLLKRSLIYPLSAILLILRAKKPLIGDLLAGLTVSVVPKTNP